MINSQQSGGMEGQIQPKLIFSPSDVGRITQSDLEQTSFTSPQYAEIAELLENLAILERTAETKLRAWKHDHESFDELSGEVNEGTQKIRRRLHDIFLSSHDYPNNHQMVLMPSDTYQYRWSHDNLTFRDSDMQNLASSIEIIAFFAQELETYLTRQGGHEEPDRQAMIRNTLHNLEEERDHLIKILTGYYEKQRKR